MSSSFIFLAVVVQAVVLLCLGLSFGSRYLHLRKLYVKWHKKEIAALLLAGKPLPPFDPWGSIVIEDARKDFWAFLVPGILFSLIPVLGVFGIIPAVFLFEGGLFNKNADYYQEERKRLNKSLQLKLEKEKRNEQHAKDRLAIRELRSRPELHEQILANPDSPYAALLKRLQNEGTASVCLVDKTITLDGKVYRLTDISHK